MSLSRTALSCLVIVLAARAARGDWPHLRGPTFDGISTETGLADAWPADGPPRLWTRELGQGHSGFVVAAGKVYTQRQSLAGQYLLCLDAKTGQNVWETRYDWAWQPKGAYPGPYATPTFYRDRVYFASPTGLIGCVNATDGKHVWSVNIQEKFDGQGYGFGYAATPLVEEDRVILPAGGADAGMIALHVDDGRVLWTSGADPASYCPALPFTFQGRRCVVGYLQNSFVLVECATGKQLFRQRLSSGYDEHSAWPLYREPHLLLMSPFRVAATRLKLETKPDGTLDCKPDWTSREFCNDIVSSVLYEGHVYGFDLKQAQSSAHRPSRGVFKCLEWDTGKTRWTTDDVGQAGIVVADGKQFLFSDTGHLILARADPTEYRELARTKLFDEICWTPPTLCDGRLFVRSPAQAVCLYVGVEKVEAAPASSMPAVSRPWRFDNSLLLSRERDYPNDAFSQDEMRLWFAACLAILTIAAIVTLAVRYFFASASVLYWPLVLVLGFLGPNVFSGLADRCLFTWPVSLYAVLHATTGICLWSEAEVGSSRRRWLARLAMLVLVLVGYGYYELCKLIGMFIAWTYLIGYLPAFPLTWLAVSAGRRQSPLLSGLWTTLAFTVFFWTCQVFLSWRAEMNP